MFSQFRYHPRDPSMNSETYHYKRGANQTFSQSTHILDPSKFPEEEVWIICCILRVVIVPHTVCEHKTWRSIQNDCCRDVFAH